MKKPFVISLTVAVVIVIAVGIYFIVQSQKKSPAPVTNPVVTEPVQQPIKFIDGRQCYTYSHQGTPDTPYTTNEFIDMTITGTKITGTKHGTQSGPDMTNGYAGTINGTFSGDMINAAFAYTVEGSQNTEQEIYQVTSLGIDKLRYPLIDKFKDGLAPDTTQTYTLQEYVHSSCDSKNLE